MSQPTKEDVMEALEKVFTKIANPSDAQAILIGVKAYAAAALFEYKKDIIYSVQMGFENDDSNFKIVERIVNVPPPINRPRA